MRKTPRAAREGRRGSDRAAPWGAEINLDLCYLPSSSSSPKSSRMGTRKWAPRRASRSTELRGQSRLPRAWPSRRNWWNWCWEGAGCPAGSVCQTPPGETPGRGNCGTPLARPAAPSPAPGRSLRCRPRLRQHPQKSSFSPPDPPWRSAGGKPSPWASAEGKVLPPPRRVPSAGRATCANVPTAPSQPPAGLSKGKTRWIRPGGAGQPRTPDTTKKQSSGKVGGFLWGVRRGGNTKKINPEQMFLCFSLTPTLETPQLEQLPPFSLAPAWARRARNERSRLQPPRPVKPEAPKEGAGIFGGENAAAR